MKIPRFEDGARRREREKISNKKACTSGAGRETPNNERVHDRCEPSVHNGATLLLCSFLSARLCHAKNWSREVCGCG